MSINSQLVPFLGTFTENLLHLEATRNNNYLLNWVEKQQSWGKYVFSLVQVRADFPDLSDSAKTWQPADHWFTLMVLPERFARWMLMPKIRPGKLRQK